MLRVYIKTNGDFGLYSINWLVLFVTVTEPACSMVQNASISKTDFILLLHLHYKVLLVVITFLLFVSSTSWKQTWSHWTYYNFCYWWTGGKHSLCLTCSEYWNTEAATQEIITVIFNLILYYINFVNNVIWLSLCKWRFSEEFWIDNVASTS